MDASGAASITAGDVDDGSNDACGLASLDVSPSSFTCNEVGSNTVTLSVTDVNDNEASDTATVTVTNDTPIVTVPPQPAVVFVTGASGAPVNNGRFEVAATDTQSLSYAWKIVCGGVDQLMALPNSAQVTVSFPATTEPKLCEVKVKVCDVCGACANEVTAIVSTAVARS